MSKIKEASPKVTQVKSSLKKLEGDRVKLTIEVKPELIETYFEQVLQAFQKKVRMPGFREGKAPVDMVAKQYAREVEEEVLKALVPDTYYQAVQIQKVSPVSLPAIRDVKLERGKSLTFTAEFDNTPEFSVKNYKGLKIKKIGIDVKPEEVEKGLQTLLESKGELTPVSPARPVRQGDHISADIELWQNGQYIPGRQGVALQIEPNDTDDFFEKIVGAQIDDTREISVDPSDEEKQSGLVGRKPMYKVTVRDIQEKKLPELNEAFAKLFGKSNVDELREAIRKDMARYRQSESYEAMKHELFEKLLALVTFEPPKSLIDKQAERLIGQMKRRYQSMGAPEEQFEKDLAEIEKETAVRAKEQVKLYFILQKIADAEKIDVDEMELERRLQGLAQESGRPVDEARQVFEEDLRESMREAKTVEFLLAHAKMEETKD